MAERKLKCANCGKWFKAADYKHTLCPNCERLERARRLAAAPAASRSGPSNGQVALVTVAGRPAGSSPPLATVARGAVAANVARAAPARPAPIAAPSPSGAGEPPARPAPPARPPATLTEAQRQAVERRYLELATPEEFDGVRGQIAAELKLPKALVKRAVNELRQRLGRRSWWELRQQAVTPEVYAAVKERYLPLLTDGALPPVGLHRQIAAEANLGSFQVYRAIGKIRADMGLPQFNEREPALEEAAAAEAPGATPS